jgi:hypothetical protein
MGAFLVKGQSQFFSTRQIIFFVPFQGTRNFDVPRRLLSNARSDAHDDSDGRGANTQQTPSGQHAGGAGRLDRPVSSECDLSSAPRQMLLRLRTTRQLAQSATSAATPTDLPCFEDNWLRANVRPHSISHAPKRCSNRYRVDLCPRARRFTRT